jgi:hypothetical protein
LTWPNRSAISLRQDDSCSFNHLVGDSDERLAIKYRGMQGHYDLLRALIADFVRRPVAVIVAAGMSMVLAEEKNPKRTFS